MGNMPLTSWLFADEQVRTELTLKLIGSSWPSCLTRAMQYNAHIHANTQYEVLYIKVTLHAHTRCMHIKENIHAT